MLADIGYEVDGIPTLFAEAAVWDQAHCLQLGTNVPVPVVEGALDAFSAHVLWLSASGPCKPRVVGSDLIKILERADRLNVKVVVFGDAIPRGLASSRTQVASFAEFRGFVSALA